jgi:hypothetical protein
MIRILIAEYDIKDTHFRSVSIASGSNLSFAVAGSFSWFERISSSAALLIVSLSRATSSSANESSTSSLFFFFLGRLVFLLLRISSIFISRRIFFAENHISNVKATHKGELTLFWRKVCEIYFNRLFPLPLPLRFGFPIFRCCCRLSA